jgi:hypothetical protein
MLVQTSLLEFRLNYTTIGKWASEKPHFNQIIDVLLDIYVLRVNITHYRTLQAWLEVLRNRNRGNPRVHDGF